MARTKVQLVASIDTSVDARIRAIAVSGEGTLSSFVNDALKQALLIHDADPDDKVNP
jgi:hypothetical protein